jgi:hypothetical protein
VGQGGVHLIFVKRRFLRKAGGRVGRMGRMGRMGKIRRKDKRSYIIEMLPSGWEEGKMGKFLSSCEFIGT